ncbi:MAG: SWIM zinc finger family protein [Ruminococcus sp.]|nr:SWIM zinc finger family protein [Ruminococcus sp.]
MLYACSCRLQYICRHLL